MPYKLVKTPEKTIKQFGGLVGSVLKNMHLAAEKEKAENQEIHGENEKAKFWRNEILTMLRQKK